MYVVCEKRVYEKRTRNDIHVQSCTFLFIRLPSSSVYICQTPLPLRASAFRGGGFFTLGERLLRHASVEHTLFFRHTIQTTLLQV